MSRSSNVLNARLGKFLCIVIVVIPLAGCWGLIKPSQVSPSALVIASCPDDLGTVRDDSFGATTEKLVEVAGVYYRCRKAVFGNTPD